MYSHKDIIHRSLFVINCITQKTLRVSNGELLLQEQVDGDGCRTITKIPFQKILAIIVIGHISITTPFIDKCKRFNVALVVLKPNLRPVYFWANHAEANFLLRHKQYHFDVKDLSIARNIVINKIKNSKALLIKTRKKDSLTIGVIQECDRALTIIPTIDDYNMLMGVEGLIAKSYFSAYFQDLPWSGRKPRVKSDPINVCLDIGYTILFNFLEIFVRMFGFDPYVGVYHRLWFKRKSLICDLMEPFRCIVDHEVLIAFKKNRFQTKDFTLKNGEFRLNPQLTMHYYQVFCDALVARKSSFWLYVQAYYRGFMRGDIGDNYIAFDY